MKFKNFLRSYLIYNSTDDSPLRYTICILVYGSITKQRTLHPLKSCLYGKVYALKANKGLEALFAYIK